MNFKTIKKIVAVTLSIMLSNVPQIFAAEQAQAQQMISTLNWVNEQNRAQTLEKVQMFLSRSDVGAQLAQTGFSATEVKDRMASLSDAELQHLSAEMDKATYGGDGVGGILIIVVLVLLIIYLAKRI
jgi:hypothetical protein